MHVDGCEITAAENDIFYGKGQLAAHCHSLYDDVLVLATESKKVFMDELTGEPDNIILPPLQKAYNKTVKEWQLPCFQMRLTHPLQHKMDIVLCLMANQHTRLKIK